VKKLRFHALPMTSSIHPARSGADKPRPESTRAPALAHARKGLAHKASVRGLQDAPKHTPGDVDPTFK